jgi:hypothetical protein
MRSGSAAPVDIEVATGKIIATHSKRRRRVEFLDFMNSVTVAFPNRRRHAVLGNLNTHKKNEDWLKAHPNVKFHFTPTSASWLNQVEVSFSILQGQSPSGVRCWHPEEKIPAWLPVNIADRSPDLASRSSMSDGLARQRRSGVEFPCVISAACRPMPRTCPNCRTVDIF